MSKEDVYKMIEEKIARKKQLNSSNDDTLTVQNHVMNFLKWADQLCKEIQNKDARKVTIAGRLFVLDTKLKSVDRWMRYDVLFNDDSGILEGIEIKWSNRARKLDPSLPERQLFKIEDFFLNELGIL